MTSADQNIAAETSGESIETAVVTVVRALGIEADIEGVKSEMSRGNTGPLTESELIPFIRKLGLEVELHTASPRKALQSGAPFILMLRDGAARAFLPASNDPAVAQSALDAAGNERDSRYYLVKPPQSNAGLDTAHMLRGNRIDWFWKPIATFLPNYLEVILCTIFINLMVVAMPLFTLNIYDRVVPTFSEPTLYILTTGILIALLFDFLFKTVRAYILEHIASVVGRQYDHDLMERLMTVNPTQVKLSMGEKANLFRELQGLRDFYAMQLAPTLVDLPFFVVFMLVIWLIAPPLMFVPLAGAAVLLVLNLAAQIPINRSTQDYFISMQSKSRALIELLAGAATFRIYNAVGNRLFQWDATSDRSARKSRQNQMLMSTVSNLSQLVLNAVSVFVIVVGVYLIQRGELTVGGLIAVTIIAGRSMGPMLSLAGVVGRWKRSGDILRTIDRIFQLPYDDEAAHRRKPKGPFQGRITLRNVAFTYPDQSHPAVTDISVTINPGDRVGIIGRSGAGKTTLASLMAGILQPTQGDILLDDYLYGVIPPTELRRTLCIVPQDPFFTSGTIQDNILLGRTDLSKADLDEAIHITGLDLVMAQSGYGLDKDVGENGFKLSGGQKQAVALTRAVIRKPKILILDEPITGLDKGIENRVLQNFSHFLKDRTFVMITHRTSLLALLNRLIVLDATRLVGDGPRDEIMRKLGSAA